MLSSLAVDTRFHTGEQLLKQGESYRVSPLGKHRYLLEDATVSFLNPSFEGSTEGTAKMWGAPDHGDESIRRYF